MVRLLCTLLLFASLAPSLQAATTLKIATIAPDGTSWMKQMRLAGEEIKKKTDGRVLLRFYPGGVMGNDNSMLRKIRAGQLQGGAITGGGLSAIYGDAQLYDLPFQFRNLQEVETVRQQMDQQIIDGLLSKGLVSFGLSEGGFAYLLSNTPVRSTEDMRGLKIWIPEGDEVNAQMFKALGISPIPLPLTDVMTGLQTGLIDTIASSPAGAIGLQWHSQVKYLTEVPLAYLYATLVIQEKALQRLTEGDRQILSETLHATFAALNQQNRKDNVQALQALQRQGITFVQPSLAQQQEWEKHANEVLNRLASQGIFSAEMLSQMQSLVHRQRTSGATN
jgi:TRAP-type transport system periplasmic protein